MKTVRLDVLSIGTLSRNRLWNETEPVRTAHSTTTLLREGRRTIIVDPGLPAPIIGARLFERSGILPDKVDTIFLTNYRPSHRGGVAAFPNAQIMMLEAEIDAERKRLQEYLELAEEDREPLEAELALLETIQPASDKLTESIDLFPLRGFTAGTCGLLVSQPTVTILIAGDAVVTQEYFLAGMVMPEAANVQAAKESLMEVYEIADLIVPGHDNLFMNPRSLGV